MESKNYYDILEVSVKASAQEITLAKNKLAKRYHPDVNMRNGIDTTDKMQEILEAYLVLSDPVKRAEYDREIRGNRPSKMQTFNLYEESEEVEDPDHPTFVTYWKAAGALYDIIEQSNALFHQKNNSTVLGELAVKALHHIILLREAKIPERYWYPDIMNWLLFKWYQNRNYNLAYLLKLYDEHEKNDMNNPGLPLSAFCEEVAALLKPQALLKCYVITHSFPVKSNVMRNIKRYNLFTHFPSRHRI